jgi:hypothetical protein
MEKNNREHHKEVLTINLDEIENHAADVLADWGEVAIDSFLENGLIRDIPVFGTALKAIQGGKAIRDYFFIQKLSEFIRHASTIKPEKIQEFRNHIENDRDFADRTAIHLTVILDRLDEKEKAILLAKIFSSYINGDIDQQQMKRLASALDRALLADIIALMHFIRDNRNLTLDNFYGLEGVGLAAVYHSITRPLDESDVHGDIGDLHFVISRTAVQLIEIAFRNIKEE